MKKLFTLTLTIAWLFTVTVPPAVMAAETMAPPVPVEECADGSVPTASGDCPDAIGIGNIYIFQGGMIFIGMLCPLQKQTNITVTVTVTVGNTTVTVTSSSTFCDYGACGEYELIGGGPN